MGATAFGLAVVLALLGLVIVLALDFVVPADGGLVALLVAMLFAAIGMSEIAGIFRLGPIGSIGFLGASGVMVVLAAGEADVGLTTALAYAIALPVAGILHFFYGPGKPSRDGPA
jgi:hypothetical protein